MNPSPGGQGAFQQQSSARVTRSQTNAVTGPAEQNLTYMLSSARIQILGLHDRPERAA